MTIVGYLPLLPLAFGLLSWGTLNIQHYSSACIETIIWELSWMMTSVFSPERLYIQIDWINNFFTTKINHHWTYLSWTMTLFCSLFFPVFTVKLLWNRG